MGEQLYNYEQDIEFVIGRAGCGKSTHLAKVADDKCIVLTPTHKAKEVLQAKGVVNVFTIHSVLKLVPQLNENMRRNEKMQRLTRVGEVDLKHITTVIIDEYSMVNTKLLDMLLELLPTKAKVLVYGDAMQLPPVDGDPIDPEFYARKIVKLTTQHRAEAPEVVETFMRFADYIETGDHRIDLRLNSKIEKGTVKDFNPDTDRALAYTNNRVLSLNDEIAHYLKLPKEISIGEQIAINGIVGTLVEPQEVELTIYPKCVSKGKLMSGDKLEDTVTSAQIDMDKFNTDISQYEVKYIEIEEEVYKIHIDLNHYAKSKGLKDFVEESQFSLIDEHNLSKEVDLRLWCRDNRKAKGVKRRGKAWSAFIAHQSLVWDMRRPYATTIHKAQGQEFSTVYIAQEDIKKVIRGGYYTKYARLMYVALSRAINKVVIV